MKHLTALMKTAPLVLRDNFSFMPTEAFNLDAFSSFSPRFCWHGNSAKFGFVAMCNVSSSKVFWKAQFPSH